MKNGDQEGEMRFNDPVRGKWILLVRFKGGVWCTGSKKSIFFFSLNDSFECQE